MKLNLNKKKKVTRKLGDQSFFVNPYVSLFQKDFILNKLLEYYNESKAKEDFLQNLLEFRANFDVLVISAVTDIEIEGTEYEDLVTSGLIDILRKTVINYEEIYQDALFMLESVRIADLMPNLESLSDTFNELPKMLEAMSPEQVERLKMVENVTANDAVLRAVKGGE